MNVLIVKTSSMGDVLHTLPAVTDAMQQLPGIRFDWVVEEGFAQIPGWHTAVNRVIPVAIRRWRKQWLSCEHRRQRSFFKKTLRQTPYDAIIDAQGLLKSAALVTRLAKGTKHGMDYRSAREPFASYFYHQRHAVGKQHHAVERTRILFAQSLGYQKPISQGDYGIAPRFLNRLPANHGNYLVFLHATTREEKHWPETHWRELLERVEASGLLVKLPWGAEHEYQRAQRLAAGLHHVDVLPKLNLEDIAIILAGARCVVSVDTGLSHLTAALDKPNVTLYGPTDPGLIGGYGRNQQSLISPSQKMSDITADWVYQQICKDLYV